MENKKLRRALNVLGMRETEVHSAVLRLAFDYHL